MVAIAYQLMVAISEVATYIVPTQLTSYITTRCVQLERNDEIHFNVYAGPLIL